jgi:hypothetical protein
MDTDLGVPPADVEAFLLTWSCLNVFGYAATPYSKCSTENALVVTS